MFGFQRGLIFATLLTSALVSAVPHHHADDSIVDWGHLSAILDVIDDNVLHNVLHNLSPKFRDGIFSKNRAAIEHIHSETPVLASKLVYLAKRQNNGTTTSSTPTSTSIAPVAPTISDAVSSQITATTVPAPTTVDVAPSTKSGEIAVSTVPGGVVFSTAGGGLVTRTSSAVTVRFTPSTSTRYFYSTAPNGQVTTSTSLVVVNAPVTETAVPTGAAGQAATSSSPGLQNTADRTSPEGIVFSMLGATFAAVVGLFATI